MNAPLKPFCRVALASLPLCMLFVAGHVRAEDSDSDHPKRPGFFQRLGNSIFHGTRKLERSDTIDPVTGGHGVEDGTLPPGSTTKRSKMSSPSTTTTPRREPGPSSSGTNDAAYPSTGATRSPANADPEAARRLKVKHTAAPRDDEPAPKPAPKKATEKGASGTKDQTSALGTDKVKDDGQGSPNKEADEYPMATKGHTSGFLKSPFPPYNELDARGMVSGTLAKDPTTGKIFRVP
jgi:hypothetical protein